MLTSIHACHPELTGSPPSLAQVRPHPPPPALKQLPFGSCRRSGNPGVVSELLRWCGRVPHVSVLSVLVHVFFLLVWNWVLLLYLILNLHLKENLDLQRSLESWRWRFGRLGITATWWSVCLPTTKRKLLDLSQIFTSTFTIKKTVSMEGQRWEVKLITK